VSLSLIVASPLNGTVAKFCSDLGHVGEHGRLFAGSRPGVFFLIYMVATLPPLLRCMLFRLSPSSTQPFGSLYIRKREKGKKEKRDINSIVFAQRCPVFLPLTPVFDSPVFPFSQTSSPVYLLATHDGVDTIVRCRIRRGVGLMYTNQLGGRWDGRSLSRLSGCLCLHLRWY